MHNIILLDIDDAILPSPRYEDCGGDKELVEKESLDVLRVNVKRLRDLSSMFDLKIQIISSWSNGCLGFDESNGLLYKRLASITKDYYTFEKKAFDIIDNSLHEFIVGISRGNKDRDIKTAISSSLIKKVFIIEDSDYSRYDNGVDVLYLKTTGFLDNGIYYKIKRNLNGEDHE